MATAQVKLRLITPAQMKAKNKLDAPHLIMGDIGTKYYAIEVIAPIATLDAAATEIAAQTAELDAAAAPVQLCIVSSSADDDDGATKHVRAVRITGYGTGLTTSGAVVPQTEDVRLAGTTKVLTTKFWTRAMHAHSIEWGSGDDDAAGAITLENTPQREEISTFVCATKALTPGGSFIKFASADGDNTETPYYVWYNKKEITTITCLTKAETPPSSCFHFFVDDGAGGETEYYCWMNVGGSDAAPMGQSGTAIECDISGAGTAIQVAEVIDGLIDAKGNVGCDNGGTADLPIINDNTGKVSDAYDGEWGYATGYGVAIEQGGDDPAFTGTAIEADISAQTTAANVGTITQTAIKASAAQVICGLATATITLTNVHNGNVSDTVDSVYYPTGFTIAKTQDGLTVVATAQTTEASHITTIAKASMDASDYFTFSAADGDNTETAYYVWYDLNDGDGDPAPAGTGIEVAIHAIATAAEIAAATKTAVEAASAATIDVCGDEMTLINELNGAATDTADSDTGFTFVKLRDGVAIATYITIAATYNEGNGSRVYVPDGYMGIIKRVRITPTIDLGNNESILTIIPVAFDDAGNTDPDCENLKYVIWDLHPKIDEVDVDDFGRIGTDDAVFTLYEDYTTASAATDFRVLFYIFKA